MRVSSFLLAAYLAISWQAIANGAQSYLPKIKDPLESPWRWSEMEHLDGKWVKCIDVGPNNVVWLGCRGEAVRYDGTALSTIPLPKELQEYGILSIIGRDARSAFALIDGTILALENDEWLSIAKGLPLDQDSQFRRDPQGRIWLAVDKSLVLISENEAFWHTAEVSDPIASFAIDSAGEFWVVEKSSGTVSRLKTEENSFVKRSSWPYLMSGPRTNTNGETRVAHDILCDSKGRVWVASTQNDVPPKSYDPRTQTWTEYDLTDAGGTNFNYSISETDDGIIRITGLEKIHRFENQNWSVYSDDRLKLTSNWSCLEQSSDGSLWFFERAVRVARIDYKHSRWTAYEGVLYELETRNGDLWFLEADSRVVRKKAIDNSWEIHASKNGLPKKINALLERNDGTLLAIGNNKEGAALSAWDGESWTLSSLPELGDNLSRIMYGETTDGLLYLMGRTKREGSYDWRLRKVATWTGNPEDKPTITKLRGLHVKGFDQAPDGKVLFGGFHLHQDKDGVLVEALPPGSSLAYVDDFEIEDGDNYWLANWGQGIEYWSNGTPLKFGEIDGLSSNYISDIELLADQRIAALTSDGLDLYDRDGWVHLELPDFRGSRDASHIKQSSNSDIWISVATNRWFIDEITSGRRLERFQTLRYSPERHPPETQIKQSESSTHSDSVTLSWTGQDKWFQTPTGKLQFSYRIEGRPWTPFSDQRTAHIDELSAGKHTIEIRARDLDGNVDPTPARYTATIIIPFWQSKWFLWIAILTFALIIGLAFTVLAQKIRYANRLSRMRLNFLTNISHELRSPLTLILGPLENVLKTVPQDSPISKPAKMAMRNATRLKTLVEQLLELRKMEVQSISPRRTPCDIVGLTRIAVADFNTIAKNHEQSVEFDANEETAWLELDTDAYRKILDNLVLNAIKYSTQGKTTRVSLRVIDSGIEDTRSIELVVEDQGVGISPNSQKQVFEPFYAEGKLERSDTRSFGIGLSIVRDLVKANNGSISLESPIANNAGSRFTISFEEFKTCFPDQANSFQKPTASEESIQHPTSSKGLILLVEDQEEIRDFLRNELSGDFTIITASNGNQALDIARAEIPDLVLADVMMPEMDGFQLTRKIHSNIEVSHIPVILQSALPPDDGKREGIESGAIDFVSKPISIPILKGKIHNLLETRQRLAENIKAQLMVGTPGDESSETAENAFIARVSKTLEERATDPRFGVSEFAASVGMSRATFYRKLKAVTNLSPIEFIKRFRMERAVTLLRKGVPITEIAMQVGYSESSSFNRGFRRHHGCSPSEFLKKTSIASRQE